MCKSAVSIFAWALCWHFFPPLKFANGQYWSIPRQCSNLQYSPCGSPTHQECCPDYLPGYSPEQGKFCDKLFSDPDTDPLAWMHAFQGFDKDGAPARRQSWNGMCNHPPAGPFFRMQVAGNKYVTRDDKAVPPYDDHGEVNATNRLQFKDSVIAQEGISFCIIGGHYRKSSFSLWEPLKGFLPIAEKSFDIGNHIHPEDSRKMNTFKRPNPNALRSNPDENDGYKLKIRYPWDEATLPTNRFEYVWLGIKKTWEGQSTYSVPLHDGYEKRPAHPEWQPDPNCENPYVVTANLIEADGIVLHNYLHITVYARPVSQPSGKNCPTGKIKLLMLEVRDQDGFPVGQFTDDVTCDQHKDKPDTLSCPSGVECREHYGTKLNHVPCMFSHPKSVVHPSIFMFAADKFSPAGSGAAGGGSAPGGGSSAPGTSTKQDFCRNNQIPQNQRKPPKVQYKANPDQYVTEVHATWRYAQMDEGWVSQLHFATMIIEDETPIQYYTSRLSYWDGLEEQSAKGCGMTTSCTDCCWTIRYPGYQSPSVGFRWGRVTLGLINSCVNESYNTNRPYGYSAQYHALRPTFLTRGGWDFFRKEYISPKFVNCHVSITSDPNSFYTVDTGYGRLPLRKTLSAYMADTYTLTNKAKYTPPDWDNRDRYSYDYSEYQTTYELPDWHNPGLSKSTDGREWYMAYFGKVRHHPILKMFDSAHQDPIVLRTEFDDKPFREYYGSRYIVPRPEFMNTQVKDLQKPRTSHDHEFTMKDMALDPKSRCPCPFLPTTPPPEIATKPPVEIEGRRTHVVNMLLAWVILVPVSFFVARFYKETYSRVFFLQEFWWYTMHVLCLITALLFTLGGIYALKVKRTLRIEDYGGPYEILWTDATGSHIYFGYTVIGVFIVHLLFGAFRLHDVEFRMIQIGLHWLFGWLEYLSAVACILSAAAIPSGIMNCVTFLIYCGFILYQVVFTLGMEYHLHKVDNELNLDPPRAYYPPPMMRLFHRDAPHALFRVIMLAVYAGGCFLFYVALHISMTIEGAEFSCFQPTAEDVAEEITG